jgi:uncharacterized Zn-finger protein
VTRPSHDKNGRIMVDKWKPVAFGYCPQDPECASCAGTGYKPNILLNVGRPSDTVACPYCTPDKYRKEIERLRKASPNLFTAPDLLKKPEPPKKKDEEEE